MNPSDLFLSPHLTEEQARAYLQSLGFRDPAAVDECFQRMADEIAVREALGRVASDLLHAILESPNPDGAVEAIGKYVSSRSGRAMFFDYLRDDPRALHVLTYVMGASPHLGEILIRTPEYFHWLVAQVERSAPDRQDHEEELVSAFATIDDPVEGLNMLRRWKRRETLRIGTRDLLRHETVQTAVAQLSDVASVVVDFALAIVMQQCLDAASRAKAPGAFAIVGTGSLGGREIGYEAEIDLLFVYDAHDAPGANASDIESFFVTVGRELVAALGEETRDGLLYKVAPPPWPHAGGGPRACSLVEYAEHYSSAEDVAERLHLTRARPIAGDAELGARFLASCQPFVFREGSGAIPLQTSEARHAADEIDRLTLSFQLTHGARHAPLRHTGTLGALDAMGKAGLITEQIRRELDHAYVFLRTAEHRRQLGLGDADLERQMLASQARVRDICASLVAN